MYRLTCDTHPDGYVGEAEAYVRMGDLQIAIELLDKALVIFPASNQIQTRRTEIAQKRAVREMEAGLSEVFSESLSKDGLSWKQAKSGNYFLDYCEGGDILFVTFESAHPPDNLVWPDGTRIAWGTKFLHRKNYSVLGVKAIKNDWYRGTELQLMFRKLVTLGFFNQFTKVIFYGGSMGGFGALTLSAALPGSVVIALNPQTSLDPSVVPWEDRFAEGRAADWAGEFADAANTAEKADKVWVCYDPFLKGDRRHVGRLPAHNLVELRLPGVGHSTPVALSELKILDTLILGIASGEMSASAFVKLSRKRRESVTYWVGMSGYLVKHPLWQLHFAERALLLDPLSARAAAAKLHATRVIARQKIPAPASSQR